MKEVAWKIFLRPERCIECHACEIACENTHGGMAHVTVQEAPLFCRHCEVPPCVAACYRDAIEVKAGRVLLLRDRCTNCGICLLACPFGAIKAKWIARDDGIRIPIVHKCDGCVDRASEKVPSANGFEIGDVRPACAATCPSGAIEWVDVKEGLALNRQKAYALYLAEGLSGEHKLAPC